ncbi:MAG: hypothetical protein WC437_04630 [Patescibacteria group bacterium]|jgi:hypothetical protein
MTIEEAQNKITELENKASTLERLLRNHTHSGLETSGRLEPKYLIADSLIADSLKAKNGFSGAFTNGDGDTVTVVSGIITDIS